MTKSTARPTAAQRQRNQAQADRKAAALARLADRAQGLATELDDRTNLYRNTETTTKMTTPIQSSINRRITGRLGHLENLKFGFNDAHLFILQALAAHYADQDLKGMGQGQNKKISKIDKLVTKEFQLKWTEIEGLQDDPTSTTSSTWSAALLTDEQAPLVKAFINNLVSSL